MTGTYKGEDFEIAMGRMEAGLCALALACSLNQFTDRPSNFPSYIDPSQGAGMELFDPQLKLKKASSSFGYGKLMAFSNPGTGYTPPPI